MIRCRLLEAQSQKAPDRQRIRRAPRDAPLRIDPFEISDQQQPEVATRRQARAAQHRRVKGSAGLFYERVEVVGIQQRVQSRVEGMPR